MNKESKLELFLSPIQLYNMISKVKLEYYKVYGENLYLETGGLF